ncbi:MAG TPA: ATP-binding cassette domain-containing protein [Terriglobales bacterium]|jgi:iron complex transport system ATP-binding protein|nr:ATP-binding cassette domain-containing protein [Terriglobales bacterium]
MTSQTPDLLNLQNVCVMRGDRVVLDDFSLVVGAEERIAILGPNGCGKSTLVKTITRECYPVVREGSSMSILGRERWSVFELRSMLGVVSNDLMSAVTGDATGLDVVLSGFFSSVAIYSNHHVKSQQRDLAHATLAQLQVCHLADRPVREMSSGEAKRILVARALVHRPRALLFDEPSNSLDVVARRSLRQTMSLLANSGIGILMVTHDLSDIVPEIDRVVLMRSGKIVADGPKEEMLVGQRLGELFGAEVEVARLDGFYHLW